LVPGKTGEGSRWFSAGPAIGLIAPPFVSATAGGSGTNTLDLFFVDRHVVPSAIEFTSTATLSPVPEPGSVASLVLGGLGLMARARKSRRGIAAA
jgi:hypothetical protein